MKILIEESVLRQALEALEQCYVIPNSKMHPRNRDKAITALRETLDAAEKVEPVAWWDEKLGSFDEKQFDHLQPLYLHKSVEKPAQVMCPVCSTWVSTLSRPVPTAEGVDRKTRR